MAFYHSLWPVKAAEAGVGIIAGTIQFAGTTNDADVIEGNGITSCEHDGSTGQFVITLEGTGSLDILCVQMTPQAASNADYQFSVEAIDEALRTIDIQVLDLATPSASDPADNDKVHLTVFFRNSSL